MNSNRFISQKPHGVYDDRLIVREYYNPNSFSIVFKRIDLHRNYIQGAKISLGPAIAELKPDSFLTLPHAFYTATAINGPEFFDLVVNVGDQRGKGNKKPSLPVFDPRFQ